MDRVEEVFYSVLSATTAITGYVSTRIYPDVLPQDGIYPAIVFSRTGGEDFTAMGGTDIKVGRATINVVALSTSIATAGTLIREVRNAVVAIDGSYGNVAIKQVDPESGPTSNYDAVLEVHISESDFSVLYSEQ